MTIDKSSGQVIWKVMPGVPGTHRVKVTAEDGQGGIAWQEFELSIPSTAQSSAAIASRLANSGASTDLPTQIFPPILSRLSPFVRIVLSPRRKEFSTPGVQDQTTGRYKTLRSSLDTTTATSS